MAKTKSLELNFSLIVIVVANKVELTLTETNVDQLTPTHLIKNIGFPN